MSSVTAGRTLRIARLALIFPLLAGCVGEWKMTVSSPPGKNDAAMQRDIAACQPKTSKQDVFAACMLERGYSIKFANGRTITNQDWQVMEQKAAVEAARETQRRAAQAAYQAQQQAASDNAEAAIITGLALLLLAAAVSGNSGGSPAPGQPLTEEPKKPECTMGAQAVTEWMTAGIGRCSGF
jgi:hypothetical protein